MTLRAAVTADVGRRNAVQMRLLAQALALSPPPFLMRELLRHIHDPMTRYDLALPNPGASLMYWHAVIYTMLDSQSGQDPGLSRAALEQMLTTTSRAEQRIREQTNALARLAEILTNAGDGVFANVEGFTRRFHHHRLLFAGLGMSAVEKLAGGAVESLLEDDPLPGVARALDARSEGDLFTMLREAHAVWSAHPENPDAVALLADSITKAMELAVGILSKHPPKEVEEVWLRSTATLGMHLTALRHKYDDHQPVLRAWLRMTLLIYGFLDAEDTDNGEEQVRHEALSRALDVAAEKLEQHPDDGFLHEAKARLHLMLGQRKAARKHAKEADRLGYSGLWKKLRNGS